MKLSTLYSFVQSGLAALVGVLALSNPAAASAAQSDSGTPTKQATERAEAADVPLKLYDAFDTQRIDPAKWHGVEIGAGASAPNAEALRGVTAGRLRLFLTTDGGTESDSGTASGSQRLRVNNPASVRAFQAAVTVRQAEAQGSSANPTSTHAGALITGHFFNDGSSRKPGDATGDVISHIGKIRDSAAGDQIEAFVGRCSDPECRSFTALASHVFNTTWTEGRADTLRFVWEPENNRFVFTVNPGTNQETVALAYDVADDDRPGIERKELRAENIVINSKSGRKQAVMKALYDNVMFNPEAIP